MNRLAAYCAALVLLFSCAGPRGPQTQDWVYWRGDPALGGYTDTPLPADPVLLWSHGTDSRTVASPLVLGGTVFWPERRGTLHGVDASGQEVYTRALDTYIESTPLILDSVLYIGCISGRLEAIDLAERGRGWTFETEGQISAAPNAARLAGRDAVVVGSYDNWLYCVDRAVGGLLSRYESGYYINGAVAVAGDVLLVGGCDAWLRLIDLTTGEQTDSLKLDAYIPASPAIRGSTAYVGDYAGNLYAVDFRGRRITGSRKLYAAPEPDGEFTSLPAVSSDRVVFYQGDRTLAAIDRRSGAPCWETLMKGRLAESAPLIARDRVLACTRTGIVSILDLRDGRVLWEYDAGEDILGSPAVVSGRFYVLTARGTLLCFGSAKDKRL